MREWIVTQNCTLKEFTDTHDPQASFYFSVLIKSREIKVNGARVSSPDTRLFPGDEVRYFLTKEQEDKPAFYVAYEDRNLLVTDKESGVNSEAVFAMLSRAYSAGEGTPRASYAEIAQCGAYAEDKGACETDRGVYFIHRLDRNTRGLTLFAKTAVAAKEAKKAFKQHATEKIYLAV
ncbi:MAG: RNA pseudouridine synthase, partial [Candidatus Scatosoma sp.]